MVEIAEDIERRSPLLLIARERALFESAVAFVVHAEQLLEAMDNEPDDKGINSFLDYGSLERMLGRTSELVIDLAISVYRLGHGLPNPRTERTT